LKNVQRWELGSSKPSFEAAADLATALDVSLDYLAGNSDNASNELLQKVTQLLKTFPEDKLKALVGLLG
jgi:transcriptional regulator with XRE-family HTH domain